MSPLTSPDSPAETAVAAPGGSGTLSGSLTGAPGTSSTAAGTRAAAARAAAVTTAETVWESCDVSVRAAVMRMSFAAAACGVGTMAAASRRRWLLAIA